MTATLETDSSDGSMAAEVATQPDNWLDAARLAREHRTLLPQSGERVALLGCGTSLYVARAMASLRESLGQGETDAWPGGDPVLDRGYDRVVAISRSGTTTEILRALEGLRHRVPVTVVTADPHAPIADLGEVISLEHVDEEAVVQSRTATTTVAMFRWHFGHDLTAAAESARQVLAVDEETLAAETLAPVRSAEQIVFVGMGWTFGLAEEASLKLKESTQSWTESYHQTEFRHGPISLSAPGRAVWAIGPLVADFARDVAATGATLLAHDRDPLAELVLVHRLCLLRAADRGLDPGRPRNLARSIILDP